VSQKLDTAFKDQEEFLRVMLEFPEIMQKVGYDDYEEFCKARHEDLETANLKEFAD